MAMKSFLPLVYLTTFLFLFGESLQPAPRIEIYERVICHTFYAQPSNSTASEHVDCKSAPVQQELAFLIGIERLSVILPSLLAIPFGALADRVGHNVILSVALFGVFLEESWPFIVCWFPDIFPIRFIWLHFLFSLVGGGVTVIVTLLHVIVATIVPADERTAIFFRLRAAGVSASILGYAMAGLLMRKNAWVPWIIGNSSLLLAGIVAALMPKTTGEEAACADDGEDVRGADVGWVRAALLLMKRVYVMAVGNKRVLVLLVSCLLCQLGGDSVSLMMIIYVSKRFGWSFADANLLNSLEMAFEFAFLVALLPPITNVLTNRGFSSLARNKYSAQGSIVALAVGCMCLAFAPVAGVAIIGLIVVASGAGQDSLLRSLATDMVDASEVSIVYSAITVMRNTGGSLSGPIYAELYAAGLRAGGNWLGLPFLFAGALFVIVAGLLVVMKDTECKNVGRDGENEALLQT
ncbi:MFS general substrate transporter [Massarina eburnea CBS 473.64]|uniref:MFS general substrate transporter n=1 Tax=Massarina eburnea CBS 473.64 TaxID=1395130 RepID=A0A6A6SCC2_9PLEO|nr:MFS general substrate transporter [Massarina eburnea CBS 473.64]